MSTRRDRAAHAIAVGIRPDLAAWPGVTLDALEMAEAYRIADMVLAEVDRIPDVSELLAYMTAEPSPPAPPKLGRSTCACVCLMHGAAQPCGCVCLQHPKTDDGAGRTGEAGAGSLATGATRPGPVVTPLDLARQPRTFELYRHRDITGKSGTGVVAWGTVWPDGTVSLRWAGETQSFSNWDSLDVLVAVHGHEGATEVRWLDGGE